MSYAPPFTITDKIMSLVAEIAEMVGHLTAIASNMPAPHLRKENRIKTIQSSLAIENNSLSIKQVTAILEGKHVLGAPDEIQEVKNAIDTYKLLLELNPYDEKDLLKAHKLMMADLVRENGRYRSGGVGIFNGEKCLHMAPPADRVPSLMSELLEWAKHTKTHPLITSCAFHYELEFIHPFADGNGRMGRLWQTLLLMQWQPVFAWIPVETIVKEHQQEYYASIARSDSEAQSTAFITFMLGCLKQALQEMQESNQDRNDTIKDTINDTIKITATELQILKQIRYNSYITREGLIEKTKLSDSTIARGLKSLQIKGLIKRTGAKKNGHWEIIEQSNK